MIHRLSAWLYRIRHRRELATARVLDELARVDRQSLFGLWRNAHVSRSMLCAILSELEEWGYVDGYWEQMEGGLRRRMCCLTPTGWSMVHARRVGR
jgi:DNA-binding PadR family transcriptional regulator